MRTAMNGTLERPALYYPYIHVRSEHWLKATLLCVPCVKRIVPDTYTPEDLPQIAPYANIVGPNGALLQAVPAFSPAAHAAQLRLLEKLRAHADQVQQRFHRDQAPTPDEYWVHDAKFSDDLLHHLIEHQLAWRSHHAGAYGNRNWYALHPKLGSAVMTTLGLSIAREQQYDVVTPAGEFHEALLSTDENTLFDNLVSSTESPLSSTAPQARHDLGQLVITLTGVNLQALRPEDIPELQESTHLRKFQQLIRNTAQHVDRDEGPEVYQRQLVAHAEEIIESWQDARSHVGADLRATLFEQGVVAAAKAARLPFGGFQPSDLAIAGGVAVALLIRDGLAIRKRRLNADPLQYLTQVADAENQGLCLTFPLGLER